MKESTLAGCGLGPPAGKGEIGMETHFWWVRHAPVVDNGGRIYGGAEIDADTSDTALFRGLARQLPKNAVFQASALSRTRQTLAAVRRAGRTDIPERVPEDARLNEQSLGDWHGRPIAEIYADGWEWPGFWMLSAEARAPGGETFVEVCARVANAIEDMAADHPGRHIVVAAHGGVIRAALAQALGLPPAQALGFSIGNCSITRIDRLQRGDEVAWRVGGVNLPPG